ncbi:zf-CCHC domain-containing protein [Tanacetum coccineum]|uniref:Zf-CCHC domain-containing protein n=1 Tax=Tanacetum coccineum TaxID=301880 RepID=A0ABQ5CVP1_9ASTR
MDSDKYLEGQSMQRPPLFESDSFIYWKNRFETYVKSKDLDLWHVITNDDFQPIQQNPKTKLDEVIHFEKQSDYLKKRLVKNNEVKIVIYNALPRKEYERIFMCNTTKEIWKTLLITHQGNNQVKDNKIDLLVQQYKQFVISEDESINSAFARFNTIITSLKALDEGYSSKNYVRKFLRALHPKWRAKVTVIEESKDLTSLSLDELIGNLKVYEMIIKKDSKIVKAKVERKSLALKAKKESSDEECLTSGSEDEEIRDDKNGKSDRKCFRCGDPNHLIGECPKPPKDKNQRAFVGGSWSNSGEEDDEKVKNETCLVAQASSEIITKNKRLKATRNSLEKELSILKEKVSTLDKNKRVDLECVKCHMLKTENEKLKEEALKLTKFEKSTHCLNEMISNQKPSGDKLGLGFNSFEASSKEIKFMKAQKKASSDGGPINIGGPFSMPAPPKAIMGPPPVVTPGSEKCVFFQKSILGHRPKHIIVNNVKVPIASDNEVKQFYKPLSKPGVGFSKPNFRSKTPPPKRVTNNYYRPKTPQPKRNVGRQNQPRGFPITWNNFPRQSYMPWEMCLPFPHPNQLHQMQGMICLEVDLEHDEWIKDNGYSKHMTGNRKLFSSYKAYKGGNVIFGSNLRGNIIGKGQICDNKCRVTFSEHNSEITKDGKVIEPKNVNEALADESWIVAMQEELNQFIANDLDENGIVSQNKARLVSQGYNQQESIDYDETYALVARLDSIRILLAYACALDFKLFQMDVKSAFLNGFINEEAVKNVVENESHFSLEVVDDGLSSFECSQNISSVSMGNRIVMVLNGSSGGKVSIRCDIVEDLLVMAVEVAGGGGNIADINKKDKNQVKMDKIEHGIGKSLDSNVCSCWRFEYLNVILTDGLTKDRVKIQIFRKRLAGEGDQWSKRFDLFSLARGLLISARFVLQAPQKQFKDISLPQKGRELLENLDTLEAVIHRVVNTYGVLRMKENKVNALKENGSQESSGTKPDKQDTSSSSGNYTTQAVDADIGPVNDEEPFAEVSCSMDADDLETDVEVIGLACMCKSGFTRDFSISGDTCGRVILFWYLLTTIPDTTPVITPPATQTDTPVIPTLTPIITPTIPPSPDYTPASPDYSPAVTTMA